MELARLIVQRTGLDIRQTGVQYMADAAWLRIGRLFLAWLEDLAEVGIGQVGEERQLIGIQRGEFGGQR
ncbi:hypothetical protein D3C78_1612590 [compost metagenome]